MPHDPHPGPPSHSGALLVWFRRDLRVADHAALYHALHSSRRVWCAFVFDTDILDRLPSREDRRVEFIWHAIVELDAGLRRAGGGLLVRHGSAREEIPRLATQLGVAAVHANHDYEPFAIERDQAVRNALAQSGIEFRTFKDQVIFERAEVRSAAGSPFSVFTPYRNAWLKKLSAADLAPYPVDEALRSLAAPPDARLPSLQDLGFRQTNLLALQVPTGASGAAALFDDFLGRIGDYRARRDFPALKGPSYLSVHLRFGTISIRALAGKAHALAGDDQTVGAAGPQTWLSELIWREFYFQILYHHPRVVGHAFRPQYEAVRFDNDPLLLTAWQRGLTGYPLVDAAMRQINASGYMHNRLRMVAASFLVKDLHVDWRLGEKYFADHLIDYDLAANNGGWQWAASTGCDAQPYFRIFNPVTQSERFDPNGHFIRRYVNELARVPDAWIHAPWRMSAADQQAAGCVIGRDYPAPAVEHDAARKITLARFAAAKEAK
jgi:deoxyribodipyrimidine photo-lyase